MARAVAVALLAADLTSATQLSAVRPTTRLLYIPLYRSVQLHPAPADGVSERSFEFDIFVQKQHIFELGFLDGLVIDYVVQPANLPGARLAVHQEDASPMFVKVNLLLTQLPTGENDT